ncbi:hypothetical protein LCGC14_1796280 [marine sediment metagenome]|uniref:Uncharacterized protein n=1 Tax=marine sediment metagenome TaxID=412755 RepID=A0A0F9J5W7_9ZZZZ
MTTALLLGLATTVVLVWLANHRLKRSIARMDSTLTRYGY